MISTRHTQSLTDFRQHATETLDRLNQTGQAEILTVNGQARAVLLSPAAYDELASQSQRGQFRKSDRAERTAAANSIRKLATEIKTKATIEELIADKHAGHKY